MTIASIRARELSRRLIGAMSSVAAFSSASVLVAGPTIAGCAPAPCPSAKTAATDASAPPGPRRSPPGLTQDQACAWLACEPSLVCVHAYSASYPGAMECARWVPPQPGRPFVSIAPLAHESWA